MNIKLLQAAHVAEERLIAAAQAQRERRIAMRRSNWSVAELQKLRADQELALKPLIAEWLELVETALGQGEVIRRME